MRITPLMTFEATLGEELESKISLNENNNNNCTKNRIKIC